MPENENYQDKKVPKITGITTTPTALLSNPCKFRGKTLDILGILSNSGGMTTREISDLTGIPVRTVGVYCRGGEKRGVFERKERWGWRVTSFGFLILSINNNNGKTNDKDKTNGGKMKDKRTLDSPKKSHRLNLSIFTNRSDITEPEQVVVEVLAKHYERTGQKFKYFRDRDHFCDVTGIDMIDVSATIARLKEEGCIYTREDELGMKIGLKVDFVEKLKSC